MTTSVDNAQTATDPPDTLDTVIDDVIRPQAPIVDRDGTFPVRVSTLSPQPACSAWPPRPTSEAPATACGRSPR